MEGTLGMGALAVVLERELRLLELPRGRLRSFPSSEKAKKTSFLWSLKIIKLRRQGGAWLRDCL